MSDQEQEELLKEEAEDLYQNAPCGYISILPDRTIAKINDVLLNWLGYTREELLFKKKFTDLVTIGGKIYYETHHEPIQRIQGFVKELNYELIRKDGSVIPCLINSTIKNDRNGNILLSRTSIFDITERKKYEKELLRAKKEADKAAKAKSQLLSVMSHEIRTPMNAIICLSHLLLQEDPQPHQIENLKILRSSAENLLQLLNSILDYSKIESGVLQIDETDFSLRDLVNIIVNTLKIKAEEKDLDLKIDYDTSIPEMVRADSVKLSQILTNLIGNAIKFTSEGFVRVNVKLISSQENNIEVAFSVIDSGPGIPKTKLSLIFEDFQQASPDITRDYGGTGLGLSISKKLISLMGSTIKVESEVGKGSAFSFLLRLKTSNKVSVRDQQKSNVLNNTRLKGVKVLLAEDNTVNVLVITKFLKSWNVSYDIASDGQEAYLKILGNNYDLVLMDLQMPVMTGYETAEKIRELKEEKYKKLPIIALTASAIVGENHKIYRIGMNGYVSKPFDPKDLYDAICKFSLKKHNNQEESRSILNSGQKTTGIFNFDKYEQLAEGDSDFLNGLTKETTENFKSYKKEFAEAVQTKDLIEFKKLLHKIQLVIDVLEIRELEKELEKGLAILSTENEQELIEYKMQLDQFFDLIIKELTVKLSQIALTSEA